MNRGVWLGGLFLSLCGWTCQAGAQEVIWRPASRPSEPPPAARLQVLPAAGASLGRPLPAGRTEAAAVIAASYNPAAAPKPVPRQWPDGLDGLEPAAPADDPLESSGFAAERWVQPAVFTGEPISVAPKPGPAPDESAPAADQTGPVLAPPQPDVVAAPPNEPAQPFPEQESWTPHFYVRGEYLLWAVKKDSVPPLVTTSTNPFDFGILGRPTTQVLFGGDGIDGGTRSGARFTAGLYLDDCDDKAIEVSGFFLGNKTQTFDANSAQFPVIARPFFSLNRNMEFSQLTAFDNLATGNLQERNTSDLWGAEANLRCCLCCGQYCPDDCDDWAGLHYRVDGLAGFRYLDLQEDLSITENIRNFPSPQNQLMNLGLMVFDDFATRNQFYGGQVGLDATVDSGPWSLNVTGKLALGDTAQEVRINGGQLVTNLNGTVTPARGGLLALSSNIGTFHGNSFSVVPEVNTTLSYHINEHWRLFAGYDLLYWTNVVRPGQQIDRTVDETLIPNFEPPGTVAPAGQNRPAVLFQRSDIWAQGLNLGLEFRY